MPKESILFSPDLDERQLDREVSQIDQRLEEVGQDIPTSFEDGGLDGMGGGGGGGAGALSQAGSTGAAAGLASKIPKPVAGVTASAAIPIALSGGVGLSMLSAMHSASARLQTSSSLLGQAWNNIWRPLGDKIDQLFIRDIVLDLVSLTESVEEFISSNDWLVDPLLKGLTDLLQGGDIFGALKDFAKIPGNLLEELGVKLPNWSDLIPELPEWEDEIPELPEWEDKIPELPEWRDKIPKLPEWSDKIPELPEWSDKVPDLPRWANLKPSLPYWGNLIPELPNWSYLDPDLPDWSHLTPDLPDWGDLIPDLPDGGDIIPDISGISDTTGGGGGSDISPSSTPQSTSTMSPTSATGVSNTDQKLDELNRNVSRLASEMSSMELKTESETIGRVATEGKRDRISDRDPLV